MLDTILQHRNKITLVMQIKTISKQMDWFWLFSMVKLSVLAINLRYLIYS